MNIKTNNVELSDANVEFAENKVSKYTNEIVVSYDAKTKEFKVSSYLIQKEEKVSDKYFTSKSTYYDKAVLKLRDLLQREYTVYRQKIIDKKRKAIKEYREEHPPVEVSIITEDDGDEITLRDF